MTDCNNNSGGNINTGCNHPCSNGGGCSGCSKREACACPQALLSGRGHLHSYDWLEGINGGDSNQLVEVMFKNTRKSYYINSANIQLHPGDVVVVEGTPGQDVGKVTMIGPLVLHQMRRANLRSDFEPKRLYRHATENDMERFRAARDREHDTMIKSRQIAAELGLKMKIGDVEYQGDGHKAIFYYIADERVDFRKLIRILAETFGVRVEMKQIGARQEAGRIGGIGPCGRPLCCATFLSKFASVGTGAARLQDISMNPQKLAGQCAKLKCCLNFEVDTYVEAGKKLPQKDILLLTKDQDFYFFKADILKREVTYSTAKNQPVNLVTIPASRAFEIITLNKRGIKPDTLTAKIEKVEKPAEFVELVGQDSLTRFDKNKKNKKRKNIQSSENGNIDRKPRHSRQQGDDSQQQRNAARSDQQPKSAAAQKNKQPKNNSRKPHWQAPQERQKKTKPTESENNPTPKSPGTPQAVRTQRARRDKTP